MKKPRVVASIEARMGSSRLPGKVLMGINGKPAIQRLVDRLRKCRTINDIVIATTTEVADDALADWCNKYKVKVFRGSKDDVLHRVVEAHKSVGTDIIVEITGDCPLTDPQIVDLGVETFLAHDVDYVSNCGRIMSWPIGQYVQVFPFHLLESIDQSVKDPVVHEHVSLHFYENPDRYRLIDLIAPDRWKAPDWRLVLDYAEDLMLINEIYYRLEPKYGESFGIEEIMSLLRANPSLLEINGHCKERAPR